MSDHGMLAGLIVAGGVVQVAGLVILALMLRESQRLTRAVAGLVAQETRKIQAQMGGGR